MTLLSHRIQETLRPSATLMMGQRAAALRAEGKDVLNLAMGEPDFDTPEFIKVAAFEALKAGFTKYTAVEGLLPLRQAIAQKLKIDQGIDYTPKQIIVSPGAKYVLSLAFLVTLNPGEEVLIPSPYWVSYPDMVSLFGGTPVILPGDAHFKLTPEILEKAITSNTKWLVLNSPSNPSGMVYTPEDLAALAHVLKRHPHVHILSDDIYEYLVYGMPFTNIGQVAPDLISRMLIVNGVSKSYAMTGWRLGYGAGPEGLISAMTAAQSQTTSNTSAAIQMAALSALTSPKPYLEEWKKAYIARRDLLWKGLSQIPGIQVHKSEGAFYLFPSVERLLGKKTPAAKTLETDLDVCTYFLEDCLVAGVPGTPFGSPGHIRFSYATSEQILNQAIERLKIGIGQLQ